MAHKGITALALFSTILLAGCAHSYRKAASDLDADKNAFIELLQTLPTEGEFYTDEGVEKAGPYLKVLLSLTEEDIKDYDIYAFLALSRGLCDHEEHQRYATEHFLEIAHPTIKLAWGAMLFDKNEATPEIVGFLMAALASDDQSAVLSRMLGPEFEGFVDRVAKYRAIGGDGTRRDS